MKSIEMDQIDGPFIKMGRGLIKGTANECGESRVGLIVAQSLFENLLTVFTGMFVTFPVVHGVASRVEAQALNGLAKCEVGNTELCPQFDNHSGLCRCDNPEREWQMLKPG
jgi:hypothetical protein